MVKCTYFSRIVKTVYKASGQELLVSNLSDDGKVYKNCGRPKSQFSTYTIRWKT